MITEPSPTTPRLRMTEEQFETWCTGEARAEFVDGEVILMSPVSAEHDDAAHFLTKLLEVYLDLRPVGKLRGGEFQVRLREQLRRVPDLLFVANEHRDRLQRTFIDGAPDAAWEIVSDDSVARDWRDKYLEYRDGGVREYWIVDPAHRTVTLYRLSDGEYQTVDPVDGRLVSEVLPGFWLRPEWLWQDPTPRAIDCLREMGFSF